MEKFEGIEIIQQGANPERAMGITQMPDRKYPQLYLRSGSAIRTVASFRNNEDATAVVNWLKSMVPSNS